MKGLRFISCSEPNVKEAINLGTMKWITGGDRITAAAKYKENESFYIQGTCFLLTNDIPPINASNTDFGTWRRIKPICFLSKFLEHPNPNADNEFHADEDINKKIEMWKGAFASLLVQIFFVKNPYPVPKEFQMLWKQLRNQNDLFGRFEREFITCDEMAFKDAKSVFAIFSAWLDSMKIKKHITFDVFEKHMTEILGKQITQNAQKGWSITVKSSFF
jgi:phage/plasmid-associated DNA primase